jgi:spore coat protein U-like protein
MKKIIVAACASAVFATPAFAGPTDSDSAVVTAAVASECSIGDIGTLDFGTLPIETASGEGALQINADRSSNSNSGIWASCNKRATINVKSTNGGLVSASNAANPSNDGVKFTNLIRYGVGLSFGGTDYAGVATTGTPNESKDTPREAFHTQVLFAGLVTKAQNAGKRPLAGTDYTDTVVVTFTAS